MARDSRKAVNVARSPSAILARSAVLFSLVGGHGCRAPHAAGSPSLAAEASPFASAAPATAASEKDQIEDVFADMKSAVLTGNYCVLPDLVDTETLRVYEVLRQQAMRAGREQVELQPLLERTLIIEMRSRLGPRLAQMTGADVLAAGIDPPPRVLDVLVENVRLAEVVVTGSTASSATVLGNTASPQRYRFVKESGRWKVDLLTIARDAEPLLARHIAKTGQTENQFIEDYVAARSGAPFDPAAWEPSSPVDELR